MIRLVTLLLQGGLIEKDKVFLKRHRIVTKSQGKLRLCAGLGYSYTLAQGASHKVNHAFQFDLNYQSYSKHAYDYDRSSHYSKPLNP